MAIHALSHSNTDPSLLCKMIEDNELPGTFHLSPSQLKEAIDTVFQDPLQHANPTQLFSKLSFLAHTISLEKLEAALKEKFSNLKDALSAARSMIQQAKLYVEKTDSSSNPSLSSTLERALNDILSYIERLLSYVGFQSLFQSFRNDEDAEWKFQKVINIFSLCYYFVTSLVSFLDAKISRLIITATLLLIGTLNFLASLLRRIPFQIPTAEPWSLLARQELLPKPSYYKSETTSILSSLMTYPMCAHTHPLIIASSGSRKLSSLHGFVYALQNGTDQELKHKQIFYLSAKNLVSCSPSDESHGLAGKILSAIERHKSECIVIIDDINLLEEVQNKALLLRLKSFLTPSEGSPRIIGLTTEENFHGFESTKPFWTPIRSQILSAEEVILLLEEFLLQHTPHVLIEKDALSHLVTGAKELVPDETDMSDICFAILFKCIRSIEQSPKSPLEVQVDRSHKKKEAKLLEDMLLPVPEHGLDIDRLDQDFHKLEDDLKVEREKKENIVAMKDLHFRVRQALIQSVVKISAIQQNLLSKEEKAELKSFMLLNFVCLPDLTELLKSQAQSINAKIMITKELVAEVLQEERRPLLHRT